MRLNIRVNSDQLINDNYITLGATKTNVTLIAFIMALEADLSKAIRHIQNNELEQALHIISSHLLKDCIMLMASLSKDQNKYELYSLFYENYLDFVNKVQNNKFTYASDAALKSFFKTGCTHRAKEQYRAMSKPKDWLDESFFINKDQSLDDAYEDCKQEEYARVMSQYGIDLSADESEDEIPAQVINAFHTLNEKCKFLVVLKYMISLSHKEIVDCLSNFYELKNENVSKSELKRCLDHLKKNTVNSLN
jgi:hypothetical protein